MGTRSLAQIQQAHLSSSGFAVLGDRRLKEFAITGSSSAGIFEVFDTDTAPEAGTYAQSTTTVTVTDTSHGLSTGDVVGIAFEAGTGGTATPGNYVITVTSANAFTITVLNSDTITDTPACRYVASTPNDGTQPKRWLLTKETSAADTFANIFRIPNEGFRTNHGAYFHMSNLTSADVFYE